MQNASLSRRSFVAGTAALSALCALGISGCSKSNSLNTTAAKPAVPADVLYAALSYSSTNCNPVGNSSALMLAATWHVFEGLYELDLHNYTTYNALASADPVKVSDTEYTVTLREGALFSDGSAVSAHDVVNAFQANMADATYEAFLSFIKSVVAQDEKTVLFTLKYPFANLLKARLALVKIYPASLSTDQLKTKPIGTGPWRYENINGDDGGTITFLPNEHYNGQFPATCKQMDWNILLDQTSRTTAITDGSVLCMEGVPDTSADQIAKAGATVEYVPGFLLPFLMFNTKKPPFDDKRVRQAFFYAIDVEKLIANQMVGHATPATSFLPEAFAHYHRASTVYSHDVEKAKSLLAAAGVTELACELIVNNNWVKSLAPQIKQDLEQVGIVATIKETKIDWASIAPPEDPNTIVPFDVILSPGDPTCFGNDPDLLMTWWYGDNVWTQGRSCWKGTPEWTKLQGLLQSAREEADGGKQQTLWNQCYDIIAESVPLYPLFHREIGTAYDVEKLENYAPISTTGLVFLGTTPLT